MPIIRNDLISVILVGDAAVGKSVFMARLMNRRGSLVDAEDPLPTPTVSADFGVTNVIVNGSRFRVQLWDTAGAERFRSLTTAYYRGVDGVFILYDITKRLSFEHVPQWLQDVREAAVKPHCAVITIGNKTDLDVNRAISHEEAAAFAKENKILWTEMSALKRDNISFAIQRLCEEIVEKSNGVLPVYFPSDWPNGTPSGLELEDGGMGRTRSCC